MSIRCRLGLHKWGEWKCAAENRCDQNRVCSRCQAKETQTLHQWEKWKYVAKDKCDQERICSCRQDKEIRKLHQWGEWMFVIEDKCDQERVCSHCQGKETRILHQWGDWEVGTELYDQIRHCHKCGADDPTLEPCPTCNGEGCIRVYDAGDSYDRYYGLGYTCSQCGGSGKIKKWDSN